MLENLHTSIEDETLKEKIKEIGIIYRRFEELVHQRYIDADDDLTLLAENWLNPLSLMEQNLDR